MQRRERWMERNEALMGWRFSGGTEVLFRDTQKPMKERVAEEKSLSD